MRIIDGTLHIPADLAMIPIARRGVAMLLADSPRAEDATLVAHELILDAVRHSHGTIKIAVTHDEDIRIEVHDQRRHLPRATLLPTDDNAPDPIAVISLVANELGSRGTRGTYVSTWAVLYDTAPTDTGDTTSEEPPASAEDRVPTESDAEALLSSGQVARMLKVAPRTVVQWAEAGLLTSSRTPGNHRRFHRREVEALMHQHADDTTAPSPRVHSQHDDRNRRKGA